MNKRGQFFILAAVIFSGLLLSVSLSVNKISASREASSFYKSSEIIDREINSVRNYQVYNDIESNQLEGFAENLSANLLDYDKNLNFILIYGNSSELIIQNFGSQKINITTDSNSFWLNGENEQFESKIRIDIGSANIFNPGNSNSSVTLNDYGNKGLIIFFQNHEYKFNITGENQVIYILQKETEEGNYVETK